MIFLIIKIKLKIIYIKKITGFLLFLFLDKKAKSIIPIMPDFVINSNELTTFAFFSEQKGKKTDLRLHSL